MATINTLANKDSVTDCLDSLYDDAVELNTELGAHTHASGGIIILRIVASCANLGTGTIDGELKITADQNRLYAWDLTGSAWRPVSISVFKAQLFS